MLFIKKWRPGTTQKNGVTPKNLMSRKVNQNIMAKIIEEKTGMTIKLSCIHGTLLIKNPDHNIDINGVNHLKKFGTHFFELVPGNYTVTISTPDFLGTSFEKKTIKVPVNENTESLVKYHFDLIGKSVIDLKQNPIIKTKESKTESEDKEKSSSPSSKSFLRYTAGKLGFTVGYIKGRLKR